jgi:hypothetical protein
MITGTCRHCGQSRLLEGFEQASHTERDEAATDTCDCKDARLSRRRAEGRTRLLNIIGEEAESRGFRPLPESVCVALVQLYALHADGLLTKTTVNDRDSWIIFTGGENGTVSVHRYMKTSLEA